MSRRATVACAAACVAVIAVPAALASGKEGAAVADAIVWLIGAGAATLAVFLAGGVLYGLHRAARDHQPLGRACGKGLLYGGLAFLGTLGTLVALGSALMMAYGAYAVLANWDEIFK